jgi:RNA polymerase sigma-70 factor (ECF subfamily)
LQTLSADSQSASPTTPLAAVSTSAPSPTAASLTDEEVVARVCAGDTQLFEILMRRYNQRLYRAARAILQSDADADDAVQQAYLNAYRHLTQFEGRAKFSTWLTRIAVYEALGRRRRHRDKFVESSDEEHVNHVASAIPDPERQTYVAQLGGLLEAALSALPEGYRSVFILREVDGFNTAETAEQLHLSEGTVKTRLHRAKDLLQRKLHDVTPVAAFRFDGERCDRLVAAVMSHLTNAKSV